MLVKYYAVFLRLGRFRSFADAVLRFLFVALRPAIVNTIWAHVLGTYKFQNNNVFRINFII